MKGLTSTYQPGKGGRLGISTEETPLSGTGLLEPHRKPEDLNVPERTHGYINGPKRLVDVFVSLAALLFFLPLLPLIALAIKIDSRGPVFFLQSRIGIDRRHPRKSPCSTCTNWMLS